MRRRRRSSRGVFKETELKRCRKSEILFTAGMLDRLQSNVHAAKQQY